MKTELESICETIKPASEERMRAARVHLDHVAKPLKALGRLEDVLVRLAGMAELRRDYRKCAVVMCADNGVVAEGVTQTGSDVTAVVAGNILNGKASVCCMAGVAGAEVLAVDIGMLTDVPGVRNCKVAYGTKNFRHGPAMTKEETQTAVMHGVNVARALAENGFSMLSAGEMGIGNTTSSSAVASVLLGRTPAEMTGRGAGLSSLQLQNKIRVIEDALACNAPDPDDPLDVLVKVGGFDIAGMCGLFLGGALAGIPVVIDGLISSVSALVAKRLCPACADYMIASHLSAEPAAASVMAELGLIPLLDIGMALGEGTGAVSVMPLIDMALRVYFDMPTFGETGIEEYKPL